MKTGVVPNENDESCQGPAVFTLGDVNESIEQNNNVMINKSILLVQVPAPPVEEKESSDLKQHESHNVARYSNNRQDATGAHS